MEEHEPSASSITAAFVGVRHPHVFSRLDILRRIDGVDVVGFYEEDGDIAARFAAETGTKRFAMLNDLLALKPDLTVVEALDIDVPRLAAAAAPHTRALLLEKPGAPDRKQMDDMAAALGRYPVHVEFGYELHYLDIVEKCRDIVHSGALGQVTLARFHAGCPIGCGSELWQSVPGDLGGVMFTEGCHMLELIVYTLGAPDRVQGAIVKLPPGDAIVSRIVTTDLFAGAGRPTDVQVGTLMYEDIGAAILYYPDKIATLDVTAWESSGWVEEWRMEYFGTNGTLVVHPYPSKLRLSLRAAAGGYPAGETRWAPPPSESKGVSILHHTYYAQLMSLIDKLRRNEAPSPEALTAAQAIVRILDGIYETARRNVTAPV